MAEGRFAAALELENRIETAFDADIYRIVSKHLKAGKIRVLPLQYSGKR